MDITDSLPAITDDDPISDISLPGSPAQQPHITDPIQASTAVTTTDTRQISLTTPNNGSDEPSTRRRRVSNHFSRYSPPTSPLSQDAMRASSIIPRLPPASNRRIVLWAPFEGMGTAMLALCTILDAFGMTSCLAAAWYCETDQALDQAIQRAWTDVYSTVFAATSFRRASRDVWDLLLAGGNAGSLLGMLNTFPFG